VHHRSTSLVCIFVTKACVDSWKKNLLNSNISSTCPHNMVNFSPLTAEIGWRVWGIPANFNGFHILVSSLHWHRSTEVNQTLHDVLPSPELVHYIHFWELLPPMEPARCKIHFVSESCVLLYWQRYCSALKQRASAKLCSVVSSRDRAAITFNIGWLNWLVINRLWQLQSPHLYMWQNIVVLYRMLCI